MFSSMGGPKIRLQSFTNSAASFSNFPSTSLLPTSLRSALYALSDRYVSPRVLLPRDRRTLTDPHTFDDVILKYGDESDRQMVIDEILQVRSDGTTPLQIMMKDQYANYVIQKMLDVVNDQQRELLITKIR